jgi:cobalt/nickel transport protein
MGERRSWQNELGFMKRNTKFVLIGLCVSLAVAFFLSPLASSFPDGLEKMIERLVRGGEVEKEAPAVAPLPDYAFPGVRSGWLSTGLAGLVGTVIVFAAVFFLGKALSRKKSPGPTGRGRD